MLRINNTLLEFKKIATIFLLVTIVLELIFYFNLNNLVACIVLFYGWYLIKTFVLTHKIMRLYPVSFLMMLGLSIFHYILPIPLTFLELKPVTFNMEVPLLTFLHHFLFVTIIVITHSLYIKISQGRNIFRFLLQKTKFYSRTTNKQIWITSILGLVFSFFNYFIYGRWQTDVTDKTLMAYIAPSFAIFIWMPLIIPFTAFRSRVKPSSKQMIQAIGAYSLLVVVICIASNVRTLLFSGVMILVFLTGIGLIFDFYKLRNLMTPRKMILYVCLFIIVTGPIMNLGTAMVAVRQLKYDLSTTDLLKETLYTYQDDELMSRLKKVDIEINNDQYLSTKIWSEDYLSNSVLNRFCNLKISDACLYHASNIGYQNDMMQADFLNQLAALCPNVLLKLFGIEYSTKLETASYSITDYLYSLSVNDNSVRGGFRIGSMPGVGMAIFGYWYLLLIIPLFIILFAMFDSFIYVKRRRYVFSYYFFTMLFMVVNYFNERHVYQYEFKFIMRAYLEGVLSFLIIMSMVRLIAPSKRLKGKEYLSKD